MILQIVETVNNIVTVETVTTILEIADFDTGVGAVQISEYDAKGDLLVATGNDAYGNLGIGNNGDVLTANSSATHGMAWAAPLGGQSDTAVCQGRLTTATGTPITTTDQTAKTTVYFALYKGNVIITGRESKFSLYSESLSSMDIDGGFDQKDAAGFIKIKGLKFKMDGENK